MLDVGLSYICFVAANLVTINACGVDVISAGLTGFQTMCLKYTLKNRSMVLIHNRNTST